MAGFNKVHGLVFAQGAVASNFTVESLASDPVVTGGGRFWENTTDHVVKYSYVDSTGAVKIGTISDAASLAAAVTTLTAAIQAEATRAEAAEQANATAVTAEQTRATGVEANLQAAITALQDAVAKAGSDAAAAVQAEQTRAEGVEAGLDGRLKTVEGSYATKTDVQTAINNLGNVFDYVGVVDGGADQASAFDLSTLEHKAAGSFYKVNTSGWFKLGAGAPFQAAKNDGLLFNTAGTVDQIEPLNYSITGAAGFIVATGNTEAGYTIDLDPALKTAISNGASGLAAEVTRAEAAEAQLQTNIDAEKTRAEAAEKTNSDAIAAEVTRAQAAEQAETARATAAEQAEVTRAQAAEAGLQTKIDANTAAIGAEVTRATGAEKTINDALTAEVSRATAAEQTIAGTVTAEVTRAQGAEANLQSEIDALSTKVGGATGDLTKLNTTAKDTLVNAINEVLGDVQAEATRATGVEGGLNTRVTAIEADYANKAYVDGKVSALGSVFHYVGLVKLGADAGSALDLSTLTDKTTGAYYKVDVGGGYWKLGTGAAQHAQAGDGLLFNTAAGVDQIDVVDGAIVGTASEIDVTGSQDAGYTVALDPAFKSRVSTLESGLSAEVTRATAAEQANATAISAETTRAEGVEAGLRSDVTALQASAGAGASALKTELNAGRKTWRSTTAALVHTAVHNFNSDEFIAQIMVQGDDGVFRNDVVPFEPADANSITLTLSESRQVKVCFISTAQLA